MPLTSKTGLLPILINKSCYNNTVETTVVQFPNLSCPAPFVLRPFAGVYNPFPYGCSVLCNHPADYEAKDVVRRAKEAWAVDGKALASCDDVATLRSHRQSRFNSRGDIGDTVPEELFRKYTSTDSRPVTPAPTVISVVTRSSHHTRRCVTPDPVSFAPTKEKTLLILDLRRSHSQETINWSGGDAAPVVVIQNNSRSPPRSATSTSLSPNSRKKKLQKSKSCATNNSLEDEKSTDPDASQRLKQQLLTSVKTLAVPDAPGADGCLTDRSVISSNEGEIIKRRGKKKKGKRGSRDAGVREGEREFQGIPEPGETQVSALGNESRGGSTRPSLTPGVPVEISEQSLPEVKVKNPSFLDPEILRRLQRQLDQETVESEFDIKRKIALQEALKGRPPVKQRHQSEQLKALKMQLRSQTDTLEKCLSIPRMFSRRSARFELPMDSRILNKLTPLQYAQKYVFASSERLVLYNQVFNLHREEFDEDDQVERCLLGKNLLTCLGEIMGRPLTEEEATQYQNVIGWTQDMNLDFRTFVGVAALCERLLGPKFIPKMPSQEEDPRHQIEQADFESLDRKLAYLSPDPRISDILIGIRDS